VTTWVTWKGVIARLDVPTTDGRLLRKSSFAAVHFPAFPIPVFARPKRPELEVKVEPTTPVQPREAQIPSLIVGRIDRVRVRRAEEPMEGYELSAEGMITMEDLLSVRPDLEIPNPLTPDTPTGYPWPVGIEVRNGVMEGDPNAGTFVCSGNWELAAMVIEEDPSVWPGVGISPTRFEMT
jgi:hypothetical protein